MMSSLMKPAAPLGFPNMGATPPIMAPGQVPGQPTGQMPTATAAQAPIAHPGVDALNARHDQMMQNAAAQFGGASQIPADGSPMPVHTGFAPQGASSAGPAAPQTAMPTDQPGGHDHQRHQMGDPRQGFLDRVHARLGGGGFGQGFMGRMGGMGGGLDLSSLLARFGGGPRPAAPAAPAPGFAATPVQNQPANVVY